VTVWVIRDGKLVDKASLPRRQPANGFPTPMVSRMQPFDSPVDGRELSTWRERDAHMREHDCVDPRDFPAGHFAARGRDAMKENDDATGFNWTDPGAGSPEKPA